MKPLLLAIVFLFVTEAHAQKFSCLPCGRTCDVTSYDKAGNCADCGMRLVESSTITFKNIGFAQLCNRIKTNKQIVLLDVRSPQEFNNTMTDRESFGRFKNAININITEIPDRISELNKYKDKEVIVYCSHSHRSPEVSYFLSTHGFKNVTNVSGGVSMLTETELACLKNEFIKF